MVIKPFNKKTKSVESVFAFNYFLSSNENFLKILQSVIDLHKCCISISKENFLIYAKYIWYICYSETDFVIVYIRTFLFDVKIFYSGDLCNPLLKSKLFIFPVKLPQIVTLLLLPT